MTKKLIWLSATALLLSACTQNTQDTRVNDTGWCITGGPIYTANDAQPIVEAVAVKNSKIIYAGDAKGDWCKSKTSKQRRLLTCSHERHHRTERVAYCVDTSFISNVLFYVVYHFMYLVSPVTIYRHQGFMTKSLYV